jgi:hypothetical protein
MQLENMTLDQLTEELSKVDQIRKNAFDWGSKDLVMLCDRRMERIRDLINQRLTVANN